MKIPFPIYALKKFRYLKKKLTLNSANNMKIPKTL